MMTLREHYRQERELHPSQPVALVVDSSKGDSRCCDHYILTVDSDEDGTIGIIGSRQSASEVGDSGDLDLAEVRTVVAEVLHCWGCPEAALAATEIGSWAAWPVDLARFEED